MTATRTALQPLSNGKAPAPKQTANSSDMLGLRSFRELATEVDARGRRRWLIRGIWPQGDYGVHGGEAKSQKSWNAADMAVSVASGTPWLNALPVDTGGAVILFAGEGGEGNIVRRLRAVADGRGLCADNLDLYVSARAPHLTDDQHMAEFTAAIARIGPALVIVDPFYLAAGGANGADLYAMGRVLETPQLVCQKFGAGLAVITHYNRNRDARGAARFTGAGPAEWGRVLIAADVEQRGTDPVTKASTVTIKATVTGGEVPDQEFRFRRQIQADDPDDLDSPLRYRVELLSDEIAENTNPRGPAARKILEALRASDGPSEARQLVDLIVGAHGHGLTRETMSRELNKLKSEGLVDYIDQGPGRSRLWRLAGEAPLRPVRNP